MTVKAIIARKGREVVTIEPTATVSNAIKMLTERKIGALVVLGADERVIGILSERDIVRRLAECGVSTLDEPVSNAMTRRVITCSEADTMASLMESMTFGKFRHLPVIEQGRLVGIVSIGDAVKYRLYEMENESKALRDYILTA